ncbi:hypothetical protein PMI04_000710 [Sphingobium sp. AP49]|uniref:hypothetical protein n=1 Tax=Sphingobium sp. AP49 TaxID=1144307 RepID=UPI00026ECECD|nr:hypothetical protein [Sphingobium sp. AP49]WHO39157.1 hypothetical protein PMI04_000710 [Sphingobium sp. AP49]
MVSGVLAPRRRLIVPAAPRYTREMLFAGMPSFLRMPGTSPHPDDVPPLLSFEGDHFVEDLTALVAGAAPLPSLLAWRDWAEPPSGMIAANGNPRYDPVAIRRGLPLAIEPDAGADIDPDGVPTAPSGPAWLRKLYLPLHLRFTYLACDLVCHRPGLPRVTRSRLKSAGIVVRRLVRDSEGEHWEDWVTTDGKRGLWFALKGGLPADPDAIATAAWDGHDAEIRARLGLPATAPMPMLDRAPLAALPDTGPALTLAGLIPVFSAAEQAVDEEPGMSSADMAQALADNARVTLATAWADPDDIRQRLRPALRNLLNLTLLPPRPSTAAIAMARSTIGSEGFDPDSGLSAMLQAALRRTWSLLAPSDVDGAPPAAADIFWASGGNQAAPRAAFDILPPNLANLLAGPWNVLVIARLHALADRPTAPHGASGEDAEARALLALALLRLRRCRIALLTTLLDQAQIKHVALLGSAPQIIDGQSYMLPRATASSAGAEIEILLGLNEVRNPADIAPDFPTLDTSINGSTLAYDVHKAGLALETMYGPIEEAGSAAGSAFPAMIERRAGAIAGPQLAAYFGVAGTAVPRLRAAGLDLFEQPASGLLLFPGPMPATAQFDAMKDAVADSYIAAAGLPAMRREARARSRVKRLRFDHDSIYAAWAFARISGRSDCEPDQIIWTNRTEPFTIAEPTDILGARPVTIQMPDIPRLIRDIPRIAKARARPYSFFITPRNSAVSVGATPQDTRRAWGIGWICSFGIPVVTICAFVLFSIIFSILIAIPGFAWMLFLKFCLPVPAPKKGG